MAAYLIGDILKDLESIVPLEWQEEWDRSGLQVGSRRDPLQGVVIAYDICREVLRFAADNDCNLVISHHPLGMKPFDTVDWSEYEGDLIRMACARGISLYSSHTNHDASDRGMNAHAANLLGLEGVEPLKKLGIMSDKEGIGLGRVGQLTKPVQITGLVTTLKDLFGSERVSVAGPIDKDIKRLALCMGSAASLLPLAVQAGADAFITGDVRYHYAVEAARSDMLLIDIGHFYSENQSPKLLCELLAPQWGKQVSIHLYDKLHSPFKFY